MNNADYDRQILTRYLLGALPEAEAERFDELSVTDDRFVNALEAAENDLVDAFARGELSAAETEKFESHYLASPLRREKAGFAEAFQAFAGREIAAGVPAEQAAEPEKAAKRPFFFFDFLTAPHAVPRLGFAAVILLAAAFGVWFALKNAGVSPSPEEFQAQRENLPKTEQNSQIPSAVNRSSEQPPEKDVARIEEKTPEPPPERKPAQKNAPVERAPRRTGRQPAPPKAVVASFILAAPLRGAGRVQTVSVPPETDYAAVQMELEADDFASYRIALVDRSSGENLWQSGRIKARTNGDGKRLAIRFPARLLKPQIYSLEVSGLSPDGAIENIGDYSFRVVR